MLKACKQGIKTCAGDSCFSVECHPPLPLPLLIRRKRHKCNPFSAHGSLSDNIYAQITSDCNIKGSGSVGQQEEIVGENGRATTEAQIYSQTVS